MTTGCTAPVSLLLAVCVLAAGCAAPLAQRTASFAAAGAPAISATNSAFALVQSSHAAAVLAQRVHDYDTTSLSQLRGKAAFGAEEDLRVRAQVFALLSSYVSGLRTVSGGKPDAAATSTAAAGAAAAAALAGDADAIPTVNSPTLANTQVAAAAAAIERVEQLLAERARSRELPHIVAQADPAIAALCVTLRRDLGTPDTPGLRNQLHTDYEQRIQLASAAIRDHVAAMSYVEREHAIRAVFALVDNEQQADAVLAQADALLADFAASHHALATTPGGASTPQFTKQLGRLALEAKQLAAAEQAVSAAGKDLP